MGQQPPYQPPPGGPPPGGYPPPTGQPPGGYPPPTGQPPGGYPPGQYPGPYQTRPMSPYGQPLSEWWKRLLAFLIDALIISVPYFVILAVIGFGFFANTRIVCNEFGCTTEGGGFVAVFFLPQLVWGTLAFIYFTVFHATPKGQTLGKMVLNVQPRVEATGGQLDYGKSAIRAGVLAGLYIVSCGVGLLLDGLWPLWDPKRQTLHDKVAGTLVVDTPQ